MTSRRRWWPERLVVVATSSSVASVASVASPAKGRTIIYTTSGGTVGSNSGRSSRSSAGSGSGRENEGGMLASRGRRDAQQVVYPHQPALYKFSRLLFAPYLRSDSVERGLRSRAQPASRRHHRLLDLTCACNPRQYASNGSREAALATTCTRDQPTSHPATISLSSPQTFEILSK